MTSIALHRLYVGDSIDKRTPIGAAFVVLGLSACLGAFLVSSDILGLSAGTMLMAYVAIFLAGFVSLLYGTGLILIDNNLWG
ncbi:MAG TPA: hypothetical protein VF374_09360 [Thermoplasmata archaeon]|jgi:hypothetical protein